MGVGINTLLNSVYKKTKIVYQVKIFSPCGAGDFLARRSLVNSLYKKTQIVYQVKMFSPLCCRRLPGAPFVSQLGVQKSQIVYLVHNFFLVYCRWLPGALLALSQIVYLVHIFFLVRIFFFVAGDFLAHYSRCHGRIATAQVAEGFSLERERERDLLGTIFHHGVVSVVRV